MSQAEIVDLLFQNRAENAQNSTRSETTNLF